MSPQNQLPICEFCHSFNQSQIQLALNFATACLGVVNLILEVIILKTKRPIVYGMAFIIAGLMSCVETVMMGTSPAVNFFTNCCGIMAYFAYVLELTYKELCVLGNIYL